MSERRCAAPRRARRARQTGNQSCCENRKRLRTRRRRFRFNHNDTINSPFAGRPKAPRGAVCRAVFPLLFGSVRGRLISADLLCVVFSFGIEEKSRRFAIDRQSRGNSLYKKCDCGDVYRKACGELGKP